jgi:hypothetical protein
MSKALLLKIKECISVLEQHEGDSGIIHEVATYILSEPGFLNDSDEATRLINAVADVIEERETSFAPALLAFTQYWQSLIQSSGISLFYLGNAENFKQLEANLDNSHIAGVYYHPGKAENAEEARQLMQTLNAAAAPFVVYDPEGAKFVQAANLIHALAVVPFYELMFLNYRPTSAVKYSHAAWLENRYRLASAADVQTLVLGNSYGYYAFPEKHTERAVNLSMHSLSIKQAHALVFHALNNLPHVNHFVFCFGLFDLYCDLFRTKDAFNKSVIDSFSLFFADNQIAMPCLAAVKHLPMLSSLIFQPAGEPTSWPMEYMAQAHIATNELLNAKDFADPQQHIGLAVMRAQAHSKLAKHEAILAENKVLIEEMAAAMKVRGKSVTWLVPPFPAPYVENIDGRMKQTNSKFLAGLGEETLRFIDWSENKDFARKHFRDGDHLNADGAKKLVIKLRKVGVAV